MLSNENPIKMEGLTTEKAVGVILIAALVALILIRRGFRGVSFPGGGGVSLG